MMNIMEHVCSFHRGLDFPVCSLDCVFSKWSGSHTNRLVMTGTFSDEHHRETEHGSCLSHNDLDFPGEQ